MNVTYISHHGTDLTVVNAARVSFDKESHYITDMDKVLIDDEGELAGHPTYLSDKDVRLINFLARNNHWTPFAHPTATFRVKAPIFVARQLHKHQVGGVVNEISRRYVDTEPEFYVPNMWRKAAPNKKQGSLDEPVASNEAPFDAYEVCVGFIGDVYEHFLKMGVCPEQARMILPLSTYTEWYWTGSLAFWSRVCRLRLAEDAQAETREVAAMLAEKCAELWPVSWEALNGNNSL